MKQKIQIILGSTRAERMGANVGKWINTIAKQRKEFDVEYLDLKDWELPFFGTADSPLIAKWREKLGEADGYIIVTPEYNHSFTAVLKNALDYDGKTMRNKPVAFVGYTAGDVGAARAIEQLRLVAVELHMAPIREAVHLSHLYEFDEKKLDTKAMHDRLERFFTQLHWWASTLKVGREKTPVAA